VREHNNFIWMNWLYLILLLYCSFQRFLQHVQSILNTVDGSELLFGGELTTNHTIPPCYGSFKPTAIKVRCNDDFVITINLSLPHLNRFINILIHISSLVHISINQSIHQSQVPLLEFLKPHNFTLCSAEIFGPFQVMTKKTKNDDGRW